MPAALVATSHSPLLTTADLPEHVAAPLAGALAEARAFALDFDPDLVVTFGPDHYNGFFYDVMPPFCVGLAATSVGDFGSQAGPLDVPEREARALSSAVLDAGLDIAVSLRMEVDHGAVQPLELLFGDIAGRPVVPVFINSVAPPFGPMSRVRLLGEAVGSHLRSSDRRVLFIASGGLSHDPPVPTLATADDAARRVLLGQHLPVSTTARAAREERVRSTARAFAEGTADIADLAPEWDRELMRMLAARELTGFDHWDPDEMTRVAGNSSHEVRSWVTAFAALAQYGTYEVTQTFYRPIRELIAGFGVMTARVA
jgi:2,3-dihydroxyphenylpropionate 1,2-dioxygenase